MAIALQNWRFSADEYQRMGQTGILSEDARVELIDGEVVAMTPIGSRHNAAVNRGNRALVMAAGSLGIVQTQGSVRLDNYTEPQPDLVLLRPRADYASHLPTPGDILLIVEIADSSLEYDRDAKSGIYAKAGVPEYWVSDLSAARLYCFSHPGGGKYRAVIERQRGERIAPHALPSCTIQVEDLFAE
jgi:Uma2 family endonuclease